jgi:hypothetical protein
MHLSYRGTIYQSSAPTINNIEIPYLGVYRGISFLGTSRYATRLQPSALLRYRGAHYTR